MSVEETNFYGLSQQVLGADETSRLVMENMALNSTASLDLSHAEQPVVLGNPTEGALLLWLREKGIDYRELKEHATILEELPFSTERKYMATVVESVQLGGKKILYVKGAPEIVRSLCRHIERNVSADDMDRQLADFQCRAMRTLGFAYQVLEEGDIAISDNRVIADRLVFMGIVAIADPVRKDVPAAVHKCIAAGIHVKIVTGDTPGTAMEIGRQIGLWSKRDKDEAIITGTEFAKLSDDELDERVLDLKIIARARPMDKKRLVESLQRKNQVVAVTGDGTNDAPALKAAHVGLSMGDGTSVAKEASDITIIDNSFGSICRAVMWGRSLYRNIQRFVLFQLTINFAAIIVVFVGSIFGTEMPLTVVQILWVNIIMDTFAALAMASLPPNPAVMNEPPRPKDEFIITPAMARTIFTCGTIFVGVLLGMLFYWRATTGELSLEQLTVFFSVFVFLQFWNMFNAKGFEACHSVLHDLRGSRTFFLVLLLIAVGQVLIVEFGGPVFRTTPLTWVQWLEVIGYTSLIAILGDVVRSIRRRIRPRPGCR